MVKKTVNQDDPSVYHLFYADEHGSAGADLTFFEYPGAFPAGPARGWCTASSRASPRPRRSTSGPSGSAARVSRGARRRCRCFADPEGMAHELAVVDRPDAPLIARHREIPAEFALQGFEGVRASSCGPIDPAAARGGADFRPRRRCGRRAALSAAAGWSCSAPEGRGRQGAGTVHHIAWASTFEDHEAWGERVRELGLHPTPVIDRFYFRSIYFREPGGVLFEIATLGPGFTVDEPLESLGEHLSLPPAFEHLRERIEPVLTPLPDIRAWRPDPT